MPKHAAAVDNDGRTTLAKNGSVVTVDPSGASFEWGLRAHTVLKHPEGVFAFGIGGAAFLRHGEKSPVAVGSLKGGVFRTDNTVGLVLGSGSILCAGNWLQWWNPAEVGTVKNATKLQSKAAEIVDDGYNGFAILTYGGGMLWWPGPIGGRTEPTAFLTEKPVWTDTVLPSMREYDMKIRSKGVVGLACLDYGTFAVFGPQHVCMFNASSNRWCVERLCDQARRIVASSNDIFVLRDGDNADDIFVRISIKKNQMPDQDGRYVEFEKEEILEKIKVDLNVFITAIGSGAPPNDVWNTVCSRIVGVPQLSVPANPVAPFVNDITTLVGQTQALIDSHNMRVDKFPLAFSVIGTPHVDRAAVATAEADLRLLVADARAVALQMEDPNADVNALRIAANGVVQRARAWQSSELPRFTHVIDDFGAAQMLPEMRATVAALSKRLESHVAACERTSARIARPVRVRRVCDALACTSHGAFQVGEAQWVTRMPCVSGEVFAANHYAVLTDTGGAEISLPNGAVKRLD